MGQLLVRGLDGRLVQLLRERAARHGRSVEAQHRAILEATFAGERETFAERALSLRARAPSGTLNSTELIRFDRDHDYEYDPDES